MWGAFSMIQCIFTIDYEIYGNGTGSLKELVYDPAKKLAAIFQKQNDSSRMPMVVDSTGSVSVALQTPMDRVAFREGSGLLTVRMLFSW